MKRWRSYGVLIAAAAVGLIACSPAPTPPPATPAPTPDWATCVPNAPRACTPFQGVVLGRFAGSVSPDGPSCVNCADSLGTARAILERLAPHHPPVIAVDAFQPDLRVLCGDVRCFGGVNIAVFTFSDATSLPIIVDCPNTIPTICKQVDHYGPP